MNLLLYGTQLIVPKNYSTCTVLAFYTIEVEL